MKRMKNNIFCNMKPKMMAKNLKKQIRPMSPITKQAEEFQTQILSLDNLVY